MRRSNDAHIFVTLQRSEQKDLSEQLSNQIQTRLNLTDKLDKTTAVSPEPSQPPLHLLPVVYPCVPADD